MPMHALSDIGKKHIPKYVVKSAFNACMFEVIKVYCFYAVRVFPGESIRVFEGNAMCDFVIELPFQNANRFKRERIEEKDWWLFDITLRRIELKEDKIYFMVSDRFNSAPVLPEAVLANYPA